MLQLTLASVDLCQAAALSHKTKGRRLVVVERALTHTPRVMNGGPQIAHILLRLRWNRSLLREIKCALGVTVDNGKNTFHLRAKHQSECIWTSPLYILLSYPIL